MRSDRQRNKGKRKRRRNHWSDTAAFFCVFSVYLMLYCAFSWFFFRSVIYVHLHLQAYYYGMYAVSYRPQATYSVKVQTSIPPNQWRIHRRGYSMCNCTNRSCHQSWHGCNALTKSVEREESRLQHNNAGLAPADDERSPYIACSLLCLTSYRVVLLHKLLQLGLVIICCETSGTADDD